jgi:WD repeat-containing protein 35
MHWNSDGSVLAIAGMKHSQRSDNTDGRPPLQEVQFYDPFGRHMRSLKVPGSKST